VEVNVKMKLKPFQVPSFVLTEPEVRPRQEGFQEVPKFRLSDLDSSTLDKLCEEFRNSVFKKAGKQQPPQSA